MKHSLRDLLNESVVTILFGIMGSVMIGASLAGWAILDWTSPAFQYLVDGAAAAILFVVWKQRGFWEGTTYALSFALFCAIPQREFSFLPVFINKSVFFVFACCSYQILWKIAGPRIRPFRFVLLGVLFALFELVATPLQAIFFGTHDVVIATSMNTILWGTLGLGVGSGIEIAETLYHYHLLDRKNNVHHSSTQR